MVFCVWSADAGFSCVILQKIINKIIKIFLVFSRLRLNIVKKPLQPVAFLAAILNAKESSVTLKSLLHVILIDQFDHCFLQNISMKCKLLPVFILLTVPFRQAFSALS